MNGRTVIVLTSSRAQPDQLEAAIADAAGPGAAVDVVIPAVLPPTLPISACPPRIVARLNGQREVASAALRRLGVRGSVSIEPSRSVATLLQALPRPDRLMLVGGAGWRLRRAAHGLADVVTVVPARSDRTPARRPLPAKAKTA